MAKFGCARIIYKCCIKKMGARRHPSRMYIFICILFVICLLYQVRTVSKLSEWLQNRRNNHQGIQPAVKRPPIIRNQRRSHHLTLVQDTQELWNFLAAQLKLHSGYHIKHLQILDDVVSILQKYKSVLSEDVTLYKSQLETDTSVTAKSMLSSLISLNTSLTQLFQETLYELKRIKDFKSYLPSQLSNDTKLKLRLLYTKVAAMVQKLSSQADQQAQSTKLGKEIQEQIHRLQNPSSCSSARKLLCGVCRDNGRCGIGCTLHNIGLCLVTAYLSNRTMILDCSGWVYSSRGWEAAFLSISKCSPEHTKSFFSNFFINSIPEYQTEAQLPDVLNQESPETIMMRMPISSEIGRYLFPAAVPKDILNRILQFNDEPSSWWWGQFKTWAVRLKEDVARDIEEHLQTHNVTKPVVGIHVRRTDKKREASYHLLDEYMVYVAEWYDAYEILHSNAQRKVYLATDELAIIEEAKTRYPSYEFIYDRSIASSAALKSRYNEQSLLGTLKDIYSLVRCDYVVCTFSSTMCRLSYELAQVEYGGYHIFKSLDDTYFKYSPPYQELGLVTHNYNASRQNEVDAHRGQIVILRDNHWDGFVEIQNKTKTGLVPVFTIKRLVGVVNYSSKVKP